MMCITIAQESRRLALADMLNAAPQCDLLMLRLDRFAKSPDLTELLAARPKPVVVACHRPQDGGQWEGTEEQRLALLRQCILHKVEYVEIDLDVADRIRRFPPSKRVITYINLQETPSNIADIYQEALRKDPDVVRLMTAVRTPEEAWPLVQILAKPPVPTVVTGVGPGGVMLAILAKKMGAPWTYAALERGMETYPGQPTVQELESIYRYGEIQRSTRFIGVAGEDKTTIGVLNACLYHLGLPVRCLPLEVGSPRLFRKVMKAAHLAGVVVGPEHRVALSGAADELEPAAREMGEVDLLVRKGEGWQGHYQQYQAALAALEASLRSRQPADRPLEGKVVMVLGTNLAARTLASGIKRRGGALVIAGRDRQAAHQIAQGLECRYVAFEALYTTTHEVLVVCSEENMEPRTGKKLAGLHAGFVRRGMTVMDLTALPGKSIFLREVEVRGCNVVQPAEILREQLALQVRLLTGREVPRDFLEEELAAHCQPEEEEELAGHPQLVAAK